MGSSGIDIRDATAKDLVITDDSLTVNLADGRTITVPLAWFPRLVHGRPEERGNWRLIAAGDGFHWPDLDEDINVRGLLEGRRSGESPDSLRGWLEKRKKAS